MATTSLFKLEMEAEHDQGASMTQDAVSLFRNAEGTIPVETTRWQTVLDRIKSDKYKNRILKARSLLGDEEAYRQYKKKLPAMTSCGTFSYREKNKVVSTTGFITADIDHIPNVEAVFKLLIQDKNVCYAFRSVSGRGIKAGIRSKDIKTDEDIKKFYHSIENYFSDLYGITLDKSCKDISPLTFMSWDRNLFINPNPQYFDISKWTKPASPPPQPVYEMPLSDGNGAGKEKYALKVLESCCDAIRNSQPGEQHPVRLKKAILIGGYTPRYIGEDTVLAELERAVRLSGAKDMKASMKTICDGLEYGKSKQITIPDLPPRQGLDDGNTTGIDGKTRIPPGATGDIEGVQDNDGWPDPIDIFDDLLLSEPTWVYDMCPAVINDFAFDEAERMGVLPEQIAGPAIVFSAGCINDRITLQVKQRDTSWLESARIWIAAIGNSSDKKTPSLNRAIKPIMQIGSRLHAQHLERKLLYDEEVRKYKLLKRRDQLQTPPPEEPVEKRLDCSDSTIEALANLLKEDGGAEKIICVWDELAGLFASFDVYKPGRSALSEDRAAILELWNGQSKKIDRVQKGFTYVPNWSACITGYAVRGAMKSFFKGRLMSDGLLQRFLLCRADDTEVEVDRVPAKGLEQRYHNVVHALFDLKPGEFNTIIKLSPEAHEIQRLFTDLLRKAKHLPGNTSTLNEHLAKFRGYFARLSLTYHCIQCVDHRTPITEPVGAHTAKMAARTLLEYHLQVAKELSPTWVSKTMTKI